MRLLSVEPFFSQPAFDSSANSFAPLSALRYITTMKCGSSTAGKWFFNRRLQAGFRMIELLMVVAIIAVVFVMYMGWAGRGGRTSERKACAKNLQRTHIALEIYAVDHGGKYPDVTGALTSAEALDALLPKYTVDASGFICPASKDSAPPSGASIAKQKISYAYYMGRRKADAAEALLTDRQVNTLSKNPGQFLFSTNGKPPGNNHGQAGGNILFTDGRVEWSAPSASFPLVLPPGVVLLNP
jgi:prepilin-type N-terminal cleavage/methylation domain-containing protein/prepilin-type processing-associated H-X9-DG protein